MPTTYTGGQCLKHFRLMGSDGLKKKNLKCLISVAVCLGFLYRFLSVSGYSLPLLCYLRNIDGYVKTTDWLVKKYTTDKLKNKLFKAVLPNLVNRRRTPSGETAHDLLIRLFTLLLAILIYLLPHRGTHGG